MAVSRWLVVGVVSGMVAIPAARATGQGSQYGEGPCPGAAADPAVVSTVVAKPDDKPKRKSSGENVTAGNGAYRMATADDDFHNQSGRVPRIGVTAIIDTAGSVVAGSVAITKSSSGRLSAAMCEAVAEMKFRPGRKAGVPVVTQYSETFNFVSSAASSTERGPEDQGSTR